MSQINFLDKNPDYACYKIGRYSYGTPRILKSLRKSGNLEIGSFCSISSGVTIFLGGDHHTEWVSTSILNHFWDFKDRKQDYEQLRTDGDVVIGNDVWLGTEALILSGVTIGDGAVIGARAVVSRSIPPYSVAVGNPAYVSKLRFKEDIIEKLLKIKWWNWEESKIKEHTPMILSEKIEDFVNKFGDL